MKYYGDRIAIELLTVAAAISIILCAALGLHLAADAHKRDQQDAAASDKRVAEAFQRAADSYHKLLCDEYKNSPNVYILDCNYPVWV